VWSSWWQYYKQCLIDLALKVFYNENIERVSHCGISRWSASQLVMDVKDKVKAKIKMASEHPWSLNWNPQRLQANVEMSSRGRKKHLAVKISHRNPLCCPQSDRFSWLTHTHLLLKLSAAHFTLLFRNDSICPLQVTNKHSSSIVCSE